MADNGDLFVNVIAKLVKQELDFAANYVDQIKKTHPIYSKSKNYL